MKNLNLIDLLVQQIGLTQDQAVQALSIITDYTKEKYPILRGNIEAFLREELENTESASKETILQ
ncbi:MAG: hypothetical protein ICV66_14435 [Chitinophagaceae bacterium]|nr:hypothetical protein [Chitinophagaceae bacterium]